VALFAVLQMVSGPNVEANLGEARRLIREAAERGAQLVALPENFGLMAMRETDKFAHLEREGEGPMQTMLAAAAREYGLWIVGGSVPLYSDDAQRALQTCFVYDECGEQRARYDKIHLFDVSLADGGEQYRESDTTAAGECVVVLDSPFGVLGLSICYDLRFPELYRALLDRGAQVLFAPSAFTHTSGAAHWELLCRARAVENLAWLVAPAQGGHHVNGRETWGHSMIVDPWGRVLAEQCASGNQLSGVVLAEVDLRHGEEIRRRFPATAHRQLVHPERR